MKFVVCGLVFISYVCVNVCLKTTPPQYDLSKFHVPTVLYTAGKDWLADPTDVAWLVGQINQSVLAHNNQPEYEHVDFIWAKDAKPMVYDDMLDWVFKK